MKLAMRRRGGGSGWCRANAVAGRGGRQLRTRAAGARSRASFLCREKRLATRSARSPPLSDSSPSLSGLNAAGYDMHELYIALIRSRNALCSQKLWPAVRSLASATRSEAGSLARSGLRALSRRESHRGSEE